MVLLVRSADSISVVYKCSALPDPGWLQMSVYNSFNNLIDQWKGNNGYAPQDFSDIQSVSSSMRSE